MGRPLWHLHCVYDSACPQCGFPPELLALVEKTDLLTFLPWAAVVTEKRGVTLEKVICPKLTWVHELGVLYRQDIVLPVVWSRLIDFVRGAIDQLADPDVFQDLSATPLMTASE